MPTLNEVVRGLAVRIEARPHAAGLREARALVEHVTGFSVSAQIVAGSNPMTQSDCQALEVLTLRREAGEPLARILGKAPFWDFEVELNGATLVPRDDTGVLVEAALARLDDKAATHHVADLGTGSGIILLALAKERQFLTGVGIDVSEDALAQAYQNAVALGVDARLRFEPGNWLDGITERFDMVVSNPPYVTIDEMQVLDPEVGQHDPHLALVAGADGLDAYRAVLPQVPDALRPGGFALFEIGAAQGQAVRALGEAAGLHFEVLLPDLAGRDRVVVFSAPR